MSQGTPEPIIRGVYEATPPTLSDNESHSLPLNQDGSVRVATSNTFVATGGQWDDTLTIVPSSDDQFASCRITQGRALHVNLRRVDASSPYSVELIGRQASTDSIPVTLDNTQSGYLSNLNNTVTVEDGAMLAGQYGLRVFAQRQDTPSTDTTADGDAQYFKSDVVGRLHVTLGTQVVQVQSNSANLATETTLASLLTSAQLIDDTVYASGGATTSKVVGLGAEVDESAPSPVLEGQIGSLRMTALRGLRVVLTAPGGADITTDFATQTTLASVYSDTTAIRTHLNNTIEADDSGTIAYGTAIAGKLTGAVDAVDTLTSNSVAAVPHLSKNRSLHVELRKGSAQFGTATDPIRTDPTGTTTQPVSGTVTVSGVSTLAEQQTQTTHLSAIKTAVELIDNTVNTGAPFSPVLDVHVKAINSSTAFTDTGVASGGVRVAPPTDATFLVSDSASQAYLADIETAVQLIDNVVVATTVSAGATSTGSGIMAVAQYDNDSLGDLDTPDDNKVYPLRVGKQRQLYTGLWLGETTTNLARGSTGGSLYTTLRDSSDAAISATSNALHVHVNNAPNVGQSGAPWTMRLQDGDGAFLADVLDLANSNPIAAAIVDASGNQITSFGGTQHAEDAAHSSGHIGTLALAVRNDNLVTTRTDADGDYTALAVDGTGQLYVKDTEVGAVLQDLVSSHNTGFPGSGIATHGVYRNPIDTTGIGDGDTVAIAATLQQSLHVSLRSGTAAIGDALATPLYTAISDGTTKATVRELGTNDALNVALVDAGGNQIVSFGGGTQYTEADTDATITGTAMMWEDTSDTLRAVSTSKPLPSQLYWYNGTAMVDLPVSNNDSKTSGAIMMAAQRDDASTVTTTEDRAGFLRINENRGLHVSLRTELGDPITTTSNRLDVQVGNTVTVDTELPAAAPLADATSNPTVPGVGAYLMAFDGTDWDRVRLSGTNGSLQTNITNTSIAVTQSTASDLKGEMKITDGTDIANVDTLTASSITLADVKGLITTAHLHGTDSTSGTATRAIKSTASGDLFVNIADQSLANVTVTDAKVESGFYAKDAAFTNGASERYVMIGAEFDDADGGSELPSTEDRVWPCRVTNKRALIVSLMDDGGNVVGRPGAGKLQAAGNPVGIQVDQIGGGHVPKAVTALAYSVTPGSVAIDDDSNWGNGPGEYDGALYHVDPVTIMNARTFQATSEAGDNTVFSARGNYVELAIKIKKTGSPDRIQFIIYWTDDEAATTPLWYKTDHGFEQAIFFVAGELASAGTDYGYQMVIPRRGQYMKITGLPNVGTVSNYYTVTIEAKARVGLL